MRNFYFVLTEVMGNGVTQLTFTCSKSKIERCEICSKLTMKTPEQRQ